MKPLKPVFGAGSLRQIPRIACFNKAATPLGVDLDALIAALQIYVDQHVGPVWGTPARLIKSTGFLKGHWAMVFLDDADQPGAEGYHDLTPDGLPLAKIFVKTTLAAKDLVSVTASHELVEMLVDPATNMMTTGPDPKVIYAYESADPVEELTFEVAGIPMSDFVYPAYFETFHKVRAVQFDHLNKLTKPFQMPSGGYQSMFKRGKWTEVYGSVSKAKRFAREDRRGHRSEQRKSGKMLPADLREIARRERA